MKEQNKTKVGFCLNKKIKSLLIPYLLWGLFYQLFLSSINIIGGASITTTLNEHLRTYVMLGSGPMWFLPVIFIATGVFLLVYQYSNKYVSLITSIILCLISLCTPVLANEIVEVILKSFTAIGFIAAGFYFERSFDYKIHSIIVMILITIMDIAFMMLNGRVGLSSRTYGYPALFILTGILGSFILIQICHWIDGDYWIVNKIAYIGNRSIIILCVHMFFIEVIRYVDYKFTNSFLPTLGVFEGVLLGAICMFLIMIFFPLFDKIHITFGY
jgi:fucose 4-O-acetylase-like acetyltransferase